MANTKISELPLYTGNTTGAYLVMNNSGQTTTYKVTKETLIGASGTSGTSGTSGSSGSSGAAGSSGTSGSNGSSGTSGVSGSSGTSGSSGISGSSGSSGDSIFAQTGSYWNTTRDVGITGSVRIDTNAGEFRVKGTTGFNNGNSTISIASASIFESGTTDLNIGLLGNGKNLILNTDIFGTTQTGSIVMKNNTVITGSLGVLGNTRMTGSLSISGNTLITGSLTISSSLATDVIVSGTVQVELPQGTVRVGGVNFPSVSVTSGSANTFVGRGTIAVNNENDSLVLVATATTGSKTQLTSLDPSNNTKTIIEFPCSSSWNNGTTEFKYPLEVTGSLTVTGSVYVTGSINNRIYNVPIVSNTASLDLSQSNIQFVSIPSSSLGVNTVFVTATNVNAGWSGVVRIEGQGASTSGFVTGSTGFILDSDKFTNAGTAEYLSGSSRLGEYATFTNNSLMLVGNFALQNNTVGK